jgi:hypothetical protein
LWYPEILTPIERCYGGCMVNAPVIDERISTSAAARLLEVSENSIRHLADRGELPCVRVGLFRTFCVADVLKLRAERVIGSGR